MLQDSGLLLRPARASDPPTARNVGGSFSLGFKEPSERINDGINHLP